MIQIKNRLFNSSVARVWLGLAVILMTVSVGSVDARDLPEIQDAGVLRHLGIPYANFITGSGDGLDADMVALFARRIGVTYEYVESSWRSVIGDLTGMTVTPRGANVEVSGSVPVRGDVIATGFTILPWRQKVIDYSSPLFPTQIWVIVTADFPLKPIRPSGSMETDIAAVKPLLKGLTVLGVADTCLDPALYGLEKAGAKTRYFKGNLNELVPAILQGEADATLVDVPMALAALVRWPGKIKIIGPLSQTQEMAYAFRQSSPKLRKAFNAFLDECRRDGTYVRLVKKYYPVVFDVYPDFFKRRVRN